MAYEKGAQIWVGVDKNIGPDTVVKADGKLLGSARYLVDMVLGALIEDERQRAVPGTLLDDFRSSRLGMTA